MRHHFNHILFSPIIAIKRKASHFHSPNIIIYVDVPWASWCIVLLKIQLNHSATSDNDT